MVGQDEDEEDFIEKFKEFNLVVNYDVGINGEYFFFLKEFV